MAGSATTVSAHRQCSGPLKADSRTADPLLTPRSRSSDARLRPRGRPADGPSDGRWDPRDSTGRLVHSIVEMAPASQWVALKQAVGRLPPSSWRLPAPVALMPHLCPPHSPSFGRRPPAPPHILSASAGASALAVAAAESPTAVTAFTTATARCCRARCVRYGGRRSQHPCRWRRVDRVHLELLPRRRGVHHRGFLKSLQGRRPCVDGLRSGCRVGFGAVGAGGHALDGCGGAFGGDRRGHCCLFPRQDNLWQANTLRRHHRGAVKRCGGRRRRGRQRRGRTPPRRQRPAAGLAALVCAAGPVDSEADSAETLCPAAL